MTYKDRKKRLEYMRKWNKKHYSENKEKEKQRTKKRRNELKEWFKEYKGKLKCTLCGETHIRCLEFHHPKGKKFEISRAIGSRSLSKKRLIEEAERCIVLCANCHRKVHFK